MFDMMKQIAVELEEHTRAFTIEAEQPAALDFCMAPGGFVHHVMRKNPNCRVDSFSLPSAMGGHDVLVAHERRDTRVRVCFTDITMFAHKFGIDTIAEDHPEYPSLLQHWPYEPRQYDLVLCDGQVLRLHVEQLSAERKNCEATRLTNTQLFLGLKMIKPGGTMVVLLHKAQAIRCFRLIHTFYQFSQVQLYKPSRAHRTRSSFYMVARDVRSDSAHARSAMDGFRISWLENTFPDQMWRRHESDTNELDEFRAMVDDFGPNFTELARPVWAVQAKALGTAKWMQQP